MQLGIMMKIQCIHCDFEETVGMTADASNHKKIMMEKKQKKNIRKSTQKLEETHQQKTGQ